MKTERNGIFSYNVLPEKERRNLSIFEIIRNKKSVSRTEISKITGINIVSVSNYIKNYEEKNLAFEKEAPESSGGRKPELVELNIKDNMVIGVDVDEKSIKVVICDIAMNLIGKEKTTRISKKDKDIADEVTKVIEESLKKLNIQKTNVRAIGMGIPDSKLVSIAGAIEKKIGIETFAGGQAYCAAFAEKRLLPEAANAKDLLYIHSDLCGGIVIKENICLGVSGSTGEMQVIGEETLPDGEKDFLEESKYLMPWGGSFGVVQMAKKEILKGVGTKIVNFVEKGDVKYLAPENVIEAAKEKDTVAGDIIQGVGINMGIRISYLVNLFSADVVVIGGGIEKAGDFILVSIKDMIKRLAFKNKAGKVKIVLSTLGEDVVSFGAASLAAREVFLKA